MGGFFLVERVLNPHLLHGHYSKSWANRSLHISKTCQQAS